MDSTFSNCHGLHFIESQKSVRFVGDHCFSYCGGLAGVVFESPSTVQRIDSFAFSWCCSLISFAVPSSVSTLGSSIFMFCSELSSVTFDTPSQVTNLPDRLFSGCGRLATLTLPDSVKAVSPSAFEDSGVTSIIDSDWTIIAGLVVRPGRVFSCLETPSSIRIPGNVREIGDKVFSGLDELEDLSFDEGILKIRISAFTG
jgi:hypothetical protein